MNADVLLGIKDIGERYGKLLNSKSEYLSY